MIGFIKIISTGIIFILCMILAISLKHKLKIKSDITVYSIYCVFYSLYVFWVYIITKTNFFGYM